MPNNVTIVVDQKQKLIFNAPTFCLRRYFMHKSSRDIFVCFFIGRYQATLINFITFRNFFKFAYFVVPASLGILKVSFW